MVGAVEDIFVVLSLEELDDADDDGVPPLVPVVKLDDEDDECIVEVCCCCGFMENLLADFVCCCDCASFCTSLVSPTADDDDFVGMVDSVEGSGFKADESILHSSIYNR